MKKWVIINIHVLVLGLFLWIIRSGESKPPFFYIDYIISICGLYTVTLGWIIPVWKRGHVENEYDRNPPKPFPMTFRMWVNIILIIGIPIFFLFGMQGLFNKDMLLFSNDGPYGLESKLDHTDFSGRWLDSYWLGQYWGNEPMDFTGFLRATLQIIDIYPIFKVIVVIGILITFIYVYAPRPKIYKDIKKILKESKPYKWNKPAL